MLVVAEQVALRLHSLSEIKKSQKGNSKNLPYIFFFCSHMDKRTDIKVYYNTVHVPTLNSHPQVVEK